MRLKCGFRGGFPQKPFILQLGISPPGTRKKGTPEHDLGAVGREFPSRRIHSRKTALETDE